MGSQPKVFQKNFIDIDSDNVTISVTDSVASDDGSSFLSQLRDRKNNTGWATTGSDDSAGTVLDIDWADAFEASSIILVQHNFKSYTIERWNGSSFEDFATPIAPTSSTDTTTEHEIPTQNLSRIRITINETQETDDDKFLAQLIVTNKVESGQFQGWPIIDGFERSLQRNAKKSLSGKYFIREQVGSFEYDLRFLNWPYDNDLKIAEAVFFSYPQGVLFWPCGGDENQFKYKRIGYRLQDIFLVQPRNEWGPTYTQGIYKNGVNFRLRLVEVI